MDVLQEVVDWADGLPEWQSDAMRRLFAANPLPKGDVEQICQAARAAHGLAEKVPLRRLTRQDIPSPIAPKQKVRLSALHSVENVNALQKDQTLSFNKDGLTVVYGDNGAGKSGYARILKQMCRARDTQEKILPNIHVQTVQGAAKATVDFEVDEVAKSERWTDGSKSAEALMSFAVFDAKCASTYLSEENPLAYVPYGLNVFDRLVKLVKHIKALAEKEAGALQTDVSAFADLAVGETPVSQLLRSLNTVTIEQVENLATLNPEETAKLTQLEGDFKNSDNSASIKLIQSQKTRLTSLKTKINGLYTSLKPEAIAKLKDSKDKLEQTNQAAETARALAFGQGVLQGTGGELWKTMFESARKFSNEQAYPGQSFPVVTASSKCMLCQSDLNSDAVKRLRDFDEFVAKDTQKTADAQKKILASEVQIFRAISLTLPEKAILDELETLDSKTLEAVKGFFTSAEACKSKVLLAVTTSVSWEEVPIVESPESKIDGVLASLQAREKELVALSNGNERSQKESELKALKSRQQLGLRKTAFLKARSRH